MGGKDRGGLQSPHLVISQKLDIDPSLGYETTANAIAATLVLLANNPAAMAAVEAELDSLGLLRSGKCGAPK